MEKQRSPKPLDEGSNPSGGAHSKIAQLAERVAVNHLVAGSSPALGAI